MKISLDNGDTWIETDSVRVIAEGVEIDEDDSPADIHFTFTHEGLITDIVVDDEIEASTSAMYGELAQDTYCESE